MSLVIRRASETDRPLLARLHAASWRDAYRGFLPDAYLDHEIEAERAAHWTGRPWRAADLGFVAETAGEPAGFVFVEVDETAFIDNLHVLLVARRRGAGRALMREVGLALPGRPISLTVFEGNVRARAFYASVGGRETETSLKSSRGRENRIIRVVWDDAARLAGVASAGAGLADAAAP